MTPLTRPTKLEPSAIELGNSQITQSIPQQTEVQIKIFNGLGRPLAAAYRTGLRQLIPHAINSSRQAVMVRLSYLFHKTVNTDTALLLNDDGEQGSREGQLIAMAINRAQPEVHGHAFNRMQSSHIDYFVSLADLEKAGGSIYLESLDLVISVVGLTDMPYHPHSLHGERQGLMPPTDSREHIHFHYHIEIHDQDGNFGDRFINVGGEVFNVKADRSGQRRNGVYIAGSPPVMSASGQAPTRCHYLPFEEAEKKLHLYLSYKEALTLGNPADVYKRELEELAHANKLEEAENKREEARIKNDQRLRDSEFEEMKRLFQREREIAAQDQTRIEARNKDRQAQLDELGHQLKLQEHELKLRAMREREEYESRSQSRKDWSETFKLIPVGISALLTIYIAYSKMKDKS